MPNDRPLIQPNPPRWQAKPKAEEIEIPGLDTDASYLEQIEQMDQLITIKLQTIDANFAKAHSILANKILPAVRRYAVNTEPVRDAAKFWASFYEKAAELRQPQMEEYYSFNEQQYEEEDNEQQQQSEVSTSRVSLDHHKQRHEQSQEPDESTVSTEGGSFMPTNAQYASTPAAAPHHSYRQNHSQQQPQSLASQRLMEDEAPSWSRSLESPLVRLGREVSNFTMHDEEDNDQSVPPPAPTPSFALPSARPTPARWDETAKSEKFALDMELLDPKGKGRALDDTILPPTQPPHNAAPTRPKFQLGSTATSTTLYSRTPQRPIYIPPRPTAASIVKPIKKYGDDDYEDSDSDVDFVALPPGMSPPVNLSPVLPKRRSKQPKLMQSPLKKAAQRITRDLLGGAQRHNSSPSNASSRPSPAPYSTQKRFADESESSTVPTPPDIRKYFTDSSVVSAMLGSGGSSASAAAAAARIQQRDQEDDNDVAAAGEVEDMMRRAQQLIDAQNAAAAAIPGLPPPIPLPASSSNLYAYSEQFIPSHPNPQPNFVLPLKPMARTSSQSSSNSKSSDSSGRKSTHTSDSDGPRPLHMHPIAPQSSLSTAEQDLLEILKKTQSGVSSSSNDFSDSDSDSWTEEEINDTAHPSAAFLLASTRRVPVGDDDDSSFGSDQSSMMDEGGYSGGVHPLIGDPALIGDDDGFGDSFSDDGDAGDEGEGEETVFGLRPQEQGGEYDEAIRLSLHGGDLDTAQFEQRIHPMVREMRRQQESPINYR